MALFHLPSVKYYPNTVNMTPAHLQHTSSIAHRPTVTQTKDDGQIPWAMDARLRLRSLRVTAPAAPDIAVDDAVALLAGRCADLRENRVICTRLQVRIEQLWRELLAIDKHGELVQREHVANAMSSVVASALLLVDQQVRSSSAVVDRLVGTRPLLARAEFVHHSLDRVCAMVDLPCDEARWRSYWTQDCIAREHDLAQLLNGPSDLKSSYARAAMDLLTFELDHKRSEHSEALVDLMAEALARLAHGSKAQIAELPAWMLSPSDVIYEPEEFESSAYASVHHGVLGPDLPVVVKCVFVDSEREREMFMNETELWYQLDHDHVARLYGACHVSSPAFWVCELASYGNFTEYFDHGAHHEDIWRLFYEIAIGLAYLHENGIVHGHLKCTNLMVGNDEKAKLSDVGFQTIRNKSKASSQELKTDDIRWKAPECIRGDVGDPIVESDVYSLGMCIVEAISMEPPWGSETDDTIAAAVLTGCLPPRPYDINDDAWDLISAMCRSNYEERLSLKDVIEQLREMADRDLRNSEAMPTTEIEDKKMRMERALLKLNQQRVVIKALRQELLDATRRGEIEYIESMISTPGFDAEAKDKHGMTALMWGAKNGQLDIVVMLAECGANIDAIDQSGRTAFLWAARKGFVDIMSFLIDRGAILSIHDADGKSALMLASEFGHEHAVSFLIEHGVSLHLCDNNGATALMNAAGSGNVLAAQHLLDAGVFVNAANNGGTTALMMASMKGNLDMVELLVNRGADVSVQDRYGDTALIHASDRGCFNVVQFLETNTSLSLVEDDIPMEMLERLQELCASMHEAETMCLHVQARLADLYTALQSESVIEAATESFMTLLHRFCYFLSSYGCKCEIARLLNGRKIVAFCERFHDDVDSFMQRHSLELDENGDWNLRWEDESREYHACHHDMIARVGELRNDLKNPTIQEEALLMLLTDWDEGNTMYNLEELLLIKDIFKHAAASPRLMFPLTPEWFIPPHEVTFDAEFAFSSEPSRLEHQGSWMDTSVAVKIFEVSDRTCRKAFTREVDIWFGLQHPHVVNLYGACHVGNPFFVVENVSSNGTLLEYLRDGQNKNRGTVWKKLHEAALGLHYLHTKHSVLHRNLKCENIVVGHDEKARLANFSSSCHDRSPTAFNVMNSGDARWGAPECVSGQSSGSFASDVYSFGMCILEAVSCKAPWAPKSDEAVIHKLLIKRELPKRPQNMSAYQWDLVKDMCAMIPSDRIGMEKVVMRLKAIADDEQADRIAMEAEIQQPSLNNVLGLCKTMHEAREMCVQIHARIADVHQQIETGAGTGNALSACTTILHRFSSLLTKYGNKHTITRLVSTRVITETCGEIHRELDALISSHCLSASASVHKWKAQWKADTAAQQAYFKDALTQKHTLLDEFKDPSAQAEALTLLIFECNQRTAKYDADELQMIKTIFQYVVGLSQLGIPMIPDWFIPPHEVEFNRNSSFAGGAFGSVYRGVWGRTPIVIKLVKLDNERGRAMFHQEADIWFKLKHPNIVRLFGACHIGNPFFVCEDASNGTVCDYLYQKANHHKTWQKLLEAAMGLQYLHTKHKVVHRDLKCDNILVGTDDIAELSDFGLSCREDLLPPPSVDDGVAEQGAIRWKAPECLSGESNGSFASDIYSFGMCIIEAVTGDLPWGNMLDIAVRYKVSVRHELPKQPPSMTDSQWELIQQMCTTEPSDRLEIGEVVARLEEFAEQELYAHVDQDWESFEQQRQEDVPALELVQSQCSLMEEAEPLCAHIHSRLVDLEAQVTNYGLDFHDTCALIIKRFHCLLSTYSEKHMITRLIGSHVIIDTCWKLHEQLDGTMSFLGLNSNKQLHNWKPQWKEDSMTLQTGLRQAVLQENAVKDELQDPVAQAEVLDLLALECDRLIAKGDEDDVSSFP